MDPKMDSGCVEPGEEFEVLYDVSRPLLPEEALGIMDQLICHEVSVDGTGTLLFKRTVLIVLQMSWHLGYPLSQTIFTSVYVEALLMPEPGSVEQAKFVRNGNCDANQEPMLEILRAYCLGLLKACGHVNERIRSEHFYEVCSHLLMKWKLLLTPSSGGRFCTQYVQSNLINHISHLRDTGCPEQSKRDC